MRALKFITKYKNIFTFPLLLCALSTAGGCASTSQSIMSEVPQSTVRHENRGTFPFMGETLTFDVRHVATKASIADASVRVGYIQKLGDGTPYIPIIATASSKSLVRLFAKIDDRAETYISPTTWESIYSYKHMNENGRDREYSVWFWNDEQLASVERTSKGVTVKRDYVIPGDTMDTVAWVYWIRTLSLQEGKEYAWHTFDGWTINGVRLKVGPREDVWTKNGFIPSRKFEIWRERSSGIAPSGALSGVFIAPPLKTEVKSYHLATAWLADENAHTPVRLVINTGIGEFDLLLSSAGLSEPDP